MSLAEYNVSLEIHNHLSRHIIKLKSQLSQLQGRIRDIKDLEEEVVRLENEIFAAEHQLENHKAVVDAGVGKE